MDERWREEAGRIARKRCTARMADAVVLDPGGLEDVRTTAAPATPERTFCGGVGEASRVSAYPALLILPLLGFGVLVFLLVLGVIG